VLIELEDATFGYQRRPIVHVDHLDVDHGRSLGVFGPNGSGKTTLVRGISRLLPPMTGAVTHSPGLRIGYLPQYRAIDLHWPMRGIDAALLAASARQRFGWVGSQKQAALAMLKRLGVDSLANKNFAKLSGGQQQRILLAGAMASEPDILILDEPTDGLDVHSRQTLLELLREFAAGGLATVIISHEIEDLMYLCDSIARVHSADDPDKPGYVEVVAPDDLARQLTAGPRAGGVR
jgi:ABC-type Mn2+/Zn2+ transport system ATPase subunit